MCAVDTVRAAQQENQKNKATKLQRRRDHELAESYDVNAQASPQQQKTNTNAFVPPNAFIFHTFAQACEAPTPTRAEQNNGGNSTRQNISMKTHHPVLLVHNKKYENDEDEKG
jgi:hypothetical protein